MNECDPKDIAIKSFFLGPQSENEDWLREKWNLILENWITWRKSLFPSDGRAISSKDQNSESFQESLNHLNISVERILKELEQETPKFTPRYVGHMVSEISLPALLGHVCALLHNPNNTSREVSKVTSRIEDEAIQDLAKMVGFTDAAKGHFTSGGTVANIEAMWRAWSHLDRNLAIAIEIKRIDPNADFIALSQMSPTQSMNMLSKYNLDAGVLKMSCIGMGAWAWAKEFEKVWGFSFQGPVILVPANKHFSWEKSVSLLGLGEESLWTIELDEFGRLDMIDLKRKVAKAYEQKRPILLLVTVAGTTEMGEIDPIYEVTQYLDTLISSRQAYIWHHVDAAYGGYYASMLNNIETESRLGSYCTRSLKAISKADSITMDPHKLGYVPYSCGALITKDSEHYQTRQFQAPYLEQKNESRWAHTLEGSRTGAGATATWLSNRTLGLDADGYGRLLSKGLEARDLLIQELQKRMPQIAIQTPHDMNILCISVSAPGEPLSKCNKKTKHVYEKFLSSPNFSVSKTIIQTSRYKRLIDRAAQNRNLVIDSDHWFLLRIVLMNPFIVSKETTTNFVSEFVSELERFVLSTQT